MAVQFLIIAVQCAALAAFLILWYFWIKKRIESAFLIEEEDNILFPFKHFSWIFVGLIVVTCVAQVHFVRVSSQVHERMASIVSFYKKHEQNTKNVEEIKTDLQKLRKDLDGHFRAMRAERIRSDMSITGDVPDQSATTPDPAAPPRERSALMSGEPVREARSFAREAKASSSSEMDPGPAAIERKAVEDEVQSMRMSRTAKALRNNLRVRKSPSLDAPVLEKLSAGQEVKVTEKQIMGDQVWFRIVTPTGRSGWVDYRHLKLDGAA